MKRLLLLIVLAATTAGAQRHNVDSLLRVLPGLPADTVRAQVLIDLSWSFFRKDLEQTLDYANEAERLASQLGHLRKLTNARQIKSFALSGLGRYKEAEESMILAMEGYEELGNTRQIANSFMELGLLRRQIGNSTEAADYLLRAIRLGTESGDENTVAQAHNHLGGLYKEQRQYDKAVDHYNKALAIVRKLDIKPGISACLTNLAAVYVQQGLYTEAIANNEEALLLKEEAEDVLGAGRVLNNLGIAYNELGQFNRAKQYLARADSLSGIVGNQLLKNAVDYTLTVTAYGQGNYPDCIARCEELLPRLVDRADLETRTKVHHRLFLSYGAVGEFEKAFLSAAAWGAARDSLYDENIIETTNELEARFQNEQQGREIALLASEKSLQDLQLTQRVNERNAIIGFSLLVLILAGLLYNQARIRKRTNRELRELDSLKSGFFANISHEFRTPLTLIKGPIESLEQNPGESLSREDVKMIRRNTNRVLALVNQLLDLSRIDQGKMQLKPTEGDIYKCLRTAAFSFNSHAAQRCMDYNVRIPDGELWAAFDRDKMEKVVYNLLSNAFKFSEDGESVSLEAAYGNEELTLLVSDCGRGISKNELPFIFDRFYQAQGGTTRDREGSGIGLSLSRDLVELMDGTITVSSEIGKGTFFTVQIPLQKIETRRKRAPAKVQISHDIASAAPTYDLPKPDRRNVPVILLVEDNTDMRQFISGQLIGNYRILEARNGQEGLRLASVKDPDLVVTDLMMPRMDGVEFCHRLKTNLETSHIPVIILTARAGIDNKIEGLETGADEYLTKPFDAKELRVRVANLIGQRDRLREYYRNARDTVSPEHVAHTSLDRQFLEKLHELLEAEYPDPEFGPVRMQRAMGLSKTQLHRKIRALTDQTPGALLRNFRLRRAAQLLDQDADTVTQVAYSVGFNNLSYFAKCFKQAYGLSPSSYSRQQ